MRSGTKALRRLSLWLNPNRLMTAILFVGVFAMAVRVPTDSDTWWHLRAGRVMLERGQIVQTDLFSHTHEGSRWINHSWLSQIMLAWLFDRFAYAGLGLWMGLVVTAAFAFVYGQMEGSAFARALIVVLAAATAGVVWTARPQLLSFLLTAMVTYILYLFKWKGVNRLWLLPALFVLWVNLHAGYALGFMVLAAFVAGEVLNHVLASFLPTEDPVVSWRGIGLVLGVTAVSLILLALNPNTTRMWTYYLDTVRMGVLQDFVEEWASPDFHPLHTQPFVWLLLGTIGALGVSNRRVDGTDLVLVGGFAYAALLARRNFGPFALVAAPVLSRHVAAIEANLCQRRWSRRQGTTLLKAIINWSLLTLIVALAAVKATIPLRPAFNEAVQRETLPVGAAEWIEEHQPEGELFNHYNWGGYLIWRLWPDYGVYVDGRTDLYGDAFLREYLEVQMAGPGFEDVLSKHDVGFVLTPAGSVLSSQLACQDGWENGYRDDVAAIWVRERP